MKKIIIFVSLSILLITGCSNNQTPNNVVNVKNNDNEYNEKESIKTEKNQYVSYNGNLKLDGINLVNQYGETIRLKGISSHGLQWFNYLVTDNNIKSLKSWGSNVFRLVY